MAEVYQLDFFKDDEMCRLESELHKTQASLNRVRKGTYARLNELQKLYNELHEEHEYFKRALCRGKDGF